MLVWTHHFYLPLFTEKKVKYNWEWRFEHFQHEINDKKLSEVVSSVNSRLIKIYIYDLNMIYTN